MSVCFSGYRPEKLPWGGDESDPRCAVLKKRLYDAAESACAEGYRHFICGMARGVDLYACEAVLQLREKYRDVTVEAAIPCFTASSSLELNDALKAMGVTDAFDASRADLRAMGSAPNDQLYVSAVLHKTYLSLDENGTKAAAEAYMYAACKYRNGMVVVARCRDIDLWEKRDGKWLVVKRTVAGDNTMILHPDFAPDYNNGRDKVKDPSYDYFETIE